MPLTKLSFQPGINRETTQYTNEGGWYDMDKVRFRFGLPEKIGGWVKNTTASFLGVCRSLIRWNELSGTQNTGVGTNLKYYIMQGGALYDITPIRATTAAGDVTFSATSGSSVITVTDASHGAVQNDFVTFSGAASLGGNITADVLNQEYQIVSIVDANTYTISARTVSSIPSITVDGQIVDTPVLADASDVGNGGSSVVGEYQINTMLDSVVFGTGWGAGPWSRGGWGSASSTSIASGQLGLWADDNFGEDLLFCQRYGGIYYWDATSSPSARGVNITSLSGSQSAPQIALQVMVSDRDRHVIAFGCDDEFSPGVQDPMLVRFSDQENVLEWRSLPTTTAGSLRLGSGSTIVGAVETKQQIMIFTDTSLYAMQYLGPPFTFGANVVSQGISISGPNAVVAVDDFVYWMGRREFYSYGGTVETIPCTVRSYVFDDINYAQIEKVFAAHNSAFSEVWWFYPSANSDSNDRYVVYNYEQGIWYYGTMARSAWVDDGTSQLPLATDQSGHLYNHEIGYDDGSTNPPSPIYSYIQSSGTTIGNGDQFALIGRVIPDITFGNSSGSPTALMTVKASNFPGGTYLQDDGATVAKTASAPVEQFTNQIYLRLRGRSFFFRVESDGSGVYWRLGTPRAEVRTDGRR